MKGPLPTTIIAGVGRGGTTSMFQYLVAHPDVCGSTHKETRFFEPLQYGEPLPSLARYRAFFSGWKGESVVVEASPGYFAGGRVVAEQIDAVIPGVRVVVSLRDPVNRMLSFFQHARSRLQLERAMTFEAYVEACLAGTSVRESRRREDQIYQGYYGGFYAQPLLEWHQLFGERLTVVFFEDLAADVRSFTTELARLVGVDPSFYDDAVLERENPSRTFALAGVHRAVLRANEALQPMLRRRPRLKARLRTMYSRLNSPVRPAPAGETLLAALAEHFEDSNRVVRDHLRSCGYGALPNWLERT